MDECLIYHNFNKVPTFLLMRKRYLPIKKKYSKGTKLFPLKGAKASQMINQESSFQAEAAAASAVVFSSPPSVPGKRSATWV